MALEWEPRGMTWWQVDGQAGFCSKDSRDIYPRLQTVFWSFCSKIRKEKFLTDQKISNVQKETLLKAREPLTRAGRRWVSNAGKGRGLVPARDVTYL